MFEVIEIGGMKTVSTPASCNHVYIVDVSGSMSYDLPQIRQHLKNSVSLVAKPDDTMSLIWFSGRNQCGTVFENVLVSDLATVKTLHDAIDRYLKPVGLTAFVDPLVLATQLNLTTGKLNNLIFLSDGYDNQYSRSEILHKVAGLQAKYQSVTFLEYGYYADRELLSEMAATAGGTHVFADGYKRYEVVLGETISGVARVNKIDVAVNKKAKHCIYTYNNQIHIVPVVDGVASIPEDVERIHSIVPKDVLQKQLSEDHLFMILFYAAKTTNDELTWRCLEALGDVALIRSYQNAFTKQELSEFELLVQNAVLDKSQRFISGKDLDAVPDKNANTVVDLLSALSEEKANASLDTDSEHWNYNKIGRSSETIEVLPKFVKSKLASKVAMRDIVFNSERPNISIRTNQQGSVKLPENNFRLESVPSFITRNYTVIRDGIKNVKQLPVILDRSYYDTCLRDEYPHTVLEEGAKEIYVLFDLTNIPVINRTMISAVDKDEFVNDNVALEKTKAQLKVLGYYIDQLGGNDKVFAGLANQYGADAAAWLSSIGVRDYGFSPVGTTSTEATDEYMSVEVAVKIKGLSSLPAISAVQKKLTEKKKLTLSDSLIFSAMEEFKGADKEMLLFKKQQLTKVKRNLERCIAQAIYTLILGRKWFGEEEEIVVNVDMGTGFESVPLTMSKQRKLVKV
jgi:hypothetical protein